MDEYDDYESDEVIGSCVECGCDILADEYDGSGLMICDQCEWWIKAASGGPGRNS